MRRLLRAEELKAADAHAIRDIGIPSAVLMERAALTVTEELCSGAYNLASVLVVCGTGNNGGDGAAVARQLTERGYRPRLCCLGPADRRSADLRQQLSILRALDIPVEEELDLQGATLIVDALFGIGLSREVEGMDAEAIRAMNDSGLPIVAVDIPSGVHPDTGRVLGEAVRAQTTVTFTAAMPGLFLAPGAQRSGCVRTRGIGIPLPPAERGQGIYCAEEEDLKTLAARESFGNKGTFGKVLVVAGSAEICGAAYLAAKAALLSGAGMVRVLTHANNREPLSRMFPEALLTTYEESSWCTPLLAEALDWADVCVVGPGLGTGEMARRIINDLFSMNKLPTVLDADALNILAEDPRRLQDRDFPCVITPHIGEMSRLAGTDVATLKADLLAAASDAARRWNVVCVLKDARTVTAYPEGDVYLNLSGNSALATAGSGDVLAGLLGGFVAQRRSVDSKVVPATVFLHGRCGESASDQLGKSSVVASDLLPEIHKFLK